MAAVATYLLILATGWSAKLRDIGEAGDAAPVAGARGDLRGDPVAGRGGADPAAVGRSTPTSSARRQYGLTNQTFAAWLGDWAKGTALSLIFNPLLAMAIYALIRRAPQERGGCGRTGVMTAFIAIGALIGPVFIAPLFNTYSEMPAGAAARPDRRGRAARTTFPAEHIYVSDASRQTKRISANVSGIGPTIRITLNDNLLKRTAPDEVVAVMGHEMGHYVLGHVWRLIGFFVLVIGLILFAISRIAPQLIARHPRWGVRDVADPASAPVLLLLASVAGVILTPVQNSIIR